MIKVKSIAVLAVVFVVGSVIYAAEPTRQAEDFFLTLIEGDINGAYDEIFAGSGIMEAKPQEVQLLKSQTQSAFEIYGKAFAFEIIHNEQLSASLIRLVYLLKFEYLPLTWEFYFYKPRDNWKLSNITFVDQFQNISSMK